MKFPKKWVMSRGGRIIHADKTALSDVEQRVALAAVELFDQLRIEFESDDTHDGCTSENCETARVLERLK